MSTNDENKNNVPDTVHSNWIYQTNRYTYLQRSEFNEVNNNNVQEMINTMHNPDLVQPNTSPNGNLIYHIYRSGEITVQKGGWAYRQRSEFTEVNRIYEDNGRNLLKYPLKGDLGPYAIVTEQNAKKIRNSMINEFTK